MQLDIYMLEYKKDTRYLAAPATVIVIERIFTEEFMQGQGRSKERDLRVCGRVLQPGAPALVQQVQITRAG